ncbi:hypothetical protein LTR91_005880 [Friedmanniomyces endolithicus]|uniref:Uncharacterized protein n=1 Tax=Friedmanniomyces endolithicus TaxID=329885 RepID=A0AAN6KSM7_9PEZI|nr:hypothetical protein LTR75_017434 [Friedmanniomyces endolithicus]KAK0841698.1 hypothetical protein LTR03_009711 [Friedmanniomyces endolithicus]KAK0861105.1 hypothetical protein LTR87_017082 [Friedmanniomyces endolithicus]KAK0862868.1 hypothetical protein LTS02_006957 [Friedmanniomyces endolithicus]KAK0887400.1 hypothetical protein LTR02_017265 [Friedmanniomyces endolithicus]
MAALVAASDEDSEGDDEDLRPKKIQKKRKRKKHDGAADAEDDPTGLSAAEKHAKELPGLEAALEKEKAVGPDPGIPFRLFGIFCVNVQFSKAKAKGVCGYLDLRNKDEIFTLEELLAQDLQDFWTVIDNKYGYTSKDAKDQDLIGFDLRLDIARFMSTCRNLKITLEEIASDEMPDAARLPPEKHTHMGRICLYWLCVIRRVSDAAKQARVDDEDFPGGIHWNATRELQRRALPRCAAVRRGHTPRSVLHPSRQGKEHKEQERRRYRRAFRLWRQCILPPSHYPDSFKVRIDLSPHNPRGFSPRHSPHHPTLQAATLEGAAYTLSRDLTASL